jgi:hypothetical protein
MKTILHILNMITGVPQFELHLAQIYKSIEQRKRNVRVLYCDGKIINKCELNPFGRKNICGACIARIDLIKSQFQDGSVEFISFGDVERKNKINKEYQHYKETDLDQLNIAVDSCVASHLRVKEFKYISSKWRIARENLHISARKNLTIIDLLLKISGDIEHVITFNGRFPSAKAAILAAQINRIGYISFDLNRGYNHYEFENESLHSIEATTRRALKLYHLDVKKATTTALKFYSDKINNQYTFEKSYTKSQNKSISSLGLAGKEFITVFTSSDDEYRFLGKEWGDVKIVDQISEVRNLAKLVAPKQVIVRMHPNQYILRGRDLKEYKLLENVKNIRLLLPTSKIKSYDLMLNSSIVVCFCSLIGPEAVHWGKKVLTVGPSPYMKLKIGYNIDTLNDVKTLPKIKAQKDRLHIGPIIWANYLMRWIDVLPYYSHNGKGNHFVGEKAFPFRPKNPLYYLNKAEIKISKTGFFKYTFFKEVFLKAIGFITGKAVGEHNILK